MKQNAKAERILGKGGARMKEKQGMQIRTAGGIRYEFTRKKVKNINLRVRTDGTVAVSAPRCVPAERADAFVSARAAWITAARMRAKERRAEDERPYLASPEQALAIFTGISERIFPLFADVLHGQRPAIRVSRMKTRWGVCTPAKRQLTFSLRLAEKPREAIEYVVLHEYAHFVHADHSPAFWAVVARYMPDYAERRKLLSR